MLRSTRSDSRRAWPNFRIVSQTTASGNIKGATDNLSSYGVAQVPLRAAQSLARPNSSQAVISMVVAILRTVSTVRLNSPRSIAP
jgi:hypothetical protein